MVWSFCGTDQVDSNDHILSQEHGDRTGFGMDGWRTALGSACHLLTRKLGGDVDQSAELVKLGCGMEVSGLNAWGQVSFS